MKDGQIRWMNDRIIYGVAVIAMEFTFPDSNWGTPLTHQGCGCQESGWCLLLISASIYP